MFANGTNPSKGAAPAPTADISALEATVQRLQAQFSAMQDVDFLASRLETLERAAKAADPHDRDVTAAINALRKSVTAIEMTVGMHLAPSATLPGFTTESARVIDTITSVIADAMKQDDKKLDRAFNDLRADFTSVAGQMQAAVKQLTVLADSQVELAAHRLATAARFFSTSPVGKNATSAKGAGIVENSILKGVSNA